MSQATSRRDIAPMSLGAIEPRALAGAKPIFEWVDPASLKVDDGYQRNLSDRSMRLIRKIIEGWDWNRFKPPVAVLTEAGLELIDGQHTSIAAATHPDITEIPVMIVEAPERSDRAAAFIGHNRDRLNVTATEMHFAALTAGDETALTISQVCERAGVRILKMPPSAGVFKPKDTMAVACIGGVVDRRGAMRARQILDVLAKANAAPISAAGIRAVEMLLTEPEYAGSIAAEDLTDTIIALGPQAAQEAAVFAAAHKVQIWRALGITWFRRCKKRRAK